MPSSPGNLCQSFWKGVPDIRCVKKNWAASVKLHLLLVACATSRWTSVKFPNPLLTFPPVRKGCSDWELGWAWAGPCIRHSVLTFTFCSVKGPCSRVALIIHAACRLHDLVLYIYIYLVCGSCACLRSTCCPTLLTLHTTLGLTSLPVHF